VPATRYCLPSVVVMLSTRHPMWVQIALNALNWPFLGCVMTVGASGKILPFPIGMSAVLTLTGPAAPLDPPEAPPEVVAG
jgi:hypothetical protein